MKTFDQYLNQAIANGLVQVLDELWKPAEQQLGQRMEQGSEEIAERLRESRKALASEVESFLDELSEMTGGA